MRVVCSTSQAHGISKEKMEVIMSLYESTIRAMCSIDKVNPDPFLLAGSSIHEVRMFLDYQLDKGKPHPNDPRQNLDLRTATKLAMRDALLYSCGVDVPAPARDAERFENYSIIELSRVQLKLFKQDQGRDVMETLGRALTTTDLPNILGDVAQKILIKSFDEESEETWQVWCDVDEVRDFKQFSAVQVSEFSDLRELNEHGEFEYGYLADKAERGNLSTHGLILPISRRAIINDDVDAIKAPAKQQGLAVARLIGNLVYRQLTLNPVMSDGQRLFSDAHGNIANVIGVPSSDTLEPMIAAMKLQRGIQGDGHLNIRPRYFIAPVALEGTAEKVFRSELIGTANEPGVHNPYFGDYFTRAYDPRLDDANPSAWYIAGPKGTGVTVFFLKGSNKKPHLESKNGWNVDGVEYKVRIDATAIPVDWRGLAMNPGQ